MTALPQTMLTMLATVISSGSTIQPWNSNPSWLDKLMQLLPALIGLLGVYIGAELTNRYNVKIRKETLLREIQKDRVDKAYIPIASAIYEFREEFYSSEGKDLRYYDDNKLMFFSGKEWENLIQTVKTSLYPNKRSLLLKKHRKMIEKLHESIESLYKTEDECVYEYMDIADNNPSEQEENDCSREDIIYKMKLTNTIKRNNSGENKLAEVLFKYYKQFSNYSDEFLKEINDVYKELINYIDYVGNKIDEDEAE